MKLQYTVDAQGVHIAGVDGTNSVIYDNDLFKDTCEGFYLWLKANRKECNLVGNVSTHMGHPNAGPNEQPEALFTQFMQAYNIFKSSGGQNVPAPVRGSRKNLTNGQTTPENSAGSDLYISEAKKASPEKPLCIFIGGVATSVANAVLKDKSIIPNLMVFHINGWESSPNTNFNAIDGWACQVLIDNGVNYIVWDGDLNSWYTNPGSPNYRGTANDGSGNPIKRMPGITFANINNAFHNHYKGNFQHMYEAYGHIGDGPSVFWFFNNALWRNAVKRNKANQTVTTETYSHLLISQNDWNAYGPQLSSYMNNPENYVPVTTPLPNQPPSVAIISGNSAVPGSVTLTAIASDDQQVTKVEFFVDGVKVGEDTDSPYSVQWGTGLGTFVVQARATDNEGAQTISAPVSVVVADVVEPLPGDCECDVKAGVTETLSAGSPATVTSRKEGKTHVFDFGVPQGLQGPPGTGTGGVSAWPFSYMKYGAKGDGVADDTEAIQRCFNDAAAAHSKVLAEPPPYGYVLTKQIVVRPTSGQQTWLDFEALGGTPFQHIYKGGNNSSAFLLLGVKSARWKGMNGTLSGQNNAAFIDLNTKNAQPSLTDIKFESMRFNLGSGQNAYGVRIGWQEDPAPGNGADISILHFDQVRVTGGGGSGQIGFLNVGRNTIANNWTSCFVSGCDAAVANVVFITKDGITTKYRGNGGMFFNGLHTSGNKIMAHFDFEANYSFTGCQFELDGLMLKTEQAAHNVNVAFIACEMTKVKNTHAFEINSGANLSVQSCRIIKDLDNAGFDDLVRLNLNSGVFASVSLIGNSTIAKNLIGGTGGTVAKFARANMRYENYTGVKNVGIYQDIN